MSSAPNTMSGSGSAWIVVNAQPHREQFAIENLERQDFGTYCPKIRKQLRSRYGPRDVLRPLFPGYLFVHVSRDPARWRPILSTYGVRRVIKFGDSVGYLENDFVEGLRAREQDGAIVKPDSPYSPGQEIRIVGGPFDGIISKIIEIQDKDRIVILMDLLNQAVRATVRSDQVYPLALS
jgi:transcriptional antiterminator RfaH